MAQAMSLSTCLTSTILPKLIPKLERRIHAYHEMFSLPLIAEFWEEVLHRSFQDIGINTSWTPDRSHKVGEDMRLAGIENSRISCKSGQISRNKQLGKECVKFNGSRSTKFETLEEKIAHFSTSHDDVYFMLAKKAKFDKTYKLIVFDSSVCNVKNLSWKETDTKKQWVGEGAFLANIGKSMSAQLWTTLPLDLVTFTHDFNCNTVDVPLPELAVIDSPTVIKPVAKKPKKKRPRIRLVISPTSI